MGLARVKGDRSGAPKRSWGQPLGRWPCSLETGSACSQHLQAYIGWKPEATGEGQRGGLGEKGSPKTGPEPTLASDTWLALGLFTSPSTPAIMFDHPTTEAGRFLGSPCVGPSGDKGITALSQGSLCGTDRQCFLLPHPASPSQWSWERHITQRTEM